MVVFVLLLLSTVTFDGFTATPAWASLEGALYAALAPLGEARLTVIGTLGLLAFPLLFVLVYLGFARWMAWMGDDQLTTGTVARLFVLSLVPIAIAYHLAHYFTYLLIQGQLLIRLASDPFGFGWDLFGTARYRPDIGIVGARAVWYTAVVAIVLGHVIAVYVAHVVALREFRDRRAALRSQLPMLVLMVGYTVVSLWIIAQPIVEIEIGRPEATTRSTAAGHPRGPARSATTAPTKERDDMKTALVALAILAGALFPLIASAQLPASQVILENPSIRVTLLTFAPGGATGRHQGIESEIGIVVEGELTVESPTGRQQLAPGGVYWMPGLTPHDVRNESGRPAKLWDIFLKRCD